MTLTVISSKVLEFADMAEFHKASDQTPPINDHTYIYSAQPFCISGLSFPMASTYRDRTSEFRSLSDTLQKIGGITAVNQSQNAQSPSRPSGPASSGSEFNKKASRIGLGIHETTQKISRLAQCNWNSPLYFFFHFGYQISMLYICVWIYEFISS